MHFLTLLSFVGLASAAPQGGWQGPPQQFPQFPDPIAMAISEFNGLNISGEEFDWSTGNTQLNEIKQKLYSAWGLDTNTWKGWCARYILILDEQYGPSWGPTVQNYCKVHFPPTQVQEEDD